MARDDSLIIKFRKPKHSYIYRDKPNEVIKLPKPKVSAILPPTMTKQLIAYGANTY